MKKVAVIMGSDSDFPIVSKAVVQLKKFNVPYEVHVMSAHRTPEAAAEFAHSAKDNGFGVIIAAAGMAAHLAGVLAAHTTLPVIGIPVATVAIDGAGNAGILAVQMLALSDGELADKLDKMKEEMREAVYAKDKAIAEKAAQL